MDLKSDHIFLKKIKNIFSINRSYWILNKCHNLIWELDNNEYEKLHLNFVIVKCYWLVLSEFDRKSPYLYHGFATYLSTTIRINFCSRFNMNTLHLPLMGSELTVDSQRLLLWQPWFLVTVYWHIFHCGGWNFKLEIKKIDIEWRLVITPSEVHSICLISCIISFSMLKQQNHAESYHTHINIRRV